MSKRDKASKKKGSKKEKKAELAKGAAATTPSVRTLTEQKDAVLITAQDGSPLFLVRNVLLTTQCPDPYAEGSLALFGTYSVIEPKS
jgi:hypothetical protein